MLITKKKSINIIDSSGDDWKPCSRLANMTVFHKEGADLNRTVHLPIESWVLLCVLPVAQVLNPDLGQGPDV